MAIAFRVVTTPVDKADVYPNENYTHLILLAITCW